MADMLITPAELASALQQDVDTATATLLIGLATAKVQRAAGGQRLVEATSTALIDVPLWFCGYAIDFPQRPVRSIVSMKIDGVTVTDVVIRFQKLWRYLGWSGNSSVPTQVEARCLHGYPPGAQSLELARGFVTALTASAYMNPALGAILAEQLDDYRVQYAAAADAAMVVPEAMAAALRDAYGTSAYVTSSAY